MSRKAALEVFEFLGQRSNTLTLFFAGHSASSTRKVVVMLAAFFSIPIAEQYLFSESSMERSKALGSTLWPRATYSSVMSVNTLG
jgi:hypothetical protein